ncbi:hypothetical protein D1B31_12010 [Neobacillus notoginsengisoli]|uniref:Uncharacterized protein n=1 Tax=Neobacillus notoginsengisoli TaxID=1578198 RepID=A0A417YTC7_9BACI|nr:hypothetical protein D1B31_12010 [Neobacillus notoginsengisoli]
MLVFNCVDWNGGHRLLRDAAARWRPHRRLGAEEAPLTSRGKRVPGVEINSQNFGVENKWTYI